MKNTPTSIVRHLPKARYEVAIPLLGLLAFALGCYLTRIYYESGSIATNAEFASTSIIGAENRLYLMDQASLFAPNPDAFQTKVRQVAEQLDIPAEWLMAVMYSESKFDAGVRNYKGSGATGLIQFMPAVAAEMGTSTDHLAMMGHIAQMDYVYRYLQIVRERYGEYNSLTDLYLGILYPKALNQDPCYTLYAYPSKAFKQNSGLDENGDNRVTVSDIDRRMQRLYPEAYVAR